MVSWKAASQSSLTLLSADSLNTACLPTQCSLLCWLQVSRGGQECVWLPGSGSGSLGTDGSHVVSATQLDKEEQGFHRNPRVPGIQVLQGSGTGKKAEDRELEICSEVIETVSEAGKGLPVSCQELQGNRSFTYSCEDVAGMS